MMKHLMHSEDFVHLSRSGLITFIGEGQTNDEILRFHREYVSEFGSPDNGSFDELLRDGVTVSRSGTVHPDHSLQRSILSFAADHLQARSDEFKAIERHFGHEMQTLGGDVRYPPLYRDQAALDIPSAAFQNVCSVLSAANLEAILQSHPTAYVFQDFAMSAINRRKVSGIKGDRPTSAYLFHPNIFSLLITLRADRRKLYKLMTLPIEKYCAFRLPGHIEFTNSYHDMLWEIENILSTNRELGSVRISVFIEADP